MASTEGLVPITRSFLASYYDKYPFEPLSDDVSRLSSEIRSMANNLLIDCPPTQGESILIDEADHQPPHKIDENMWKNREYMEETIFLLERSNWPEGLKRQSTPDDVECTVVLDRVKDKVHNTLKILESFQAKNAEHVFNTGFAFSFLSLSSLQLSKHISDAPQTSLGLLFSVFQPFSDTLSRVIVWLLVQVSMMLIVICDNRQFVGCGLSAMVTFLRACLILYIFYGI
ncbi:uncharacterized protein LOC129296316 [Prosopis cineraria]|uniref:uncharacterized protein LOC129296316 n=1 Tax=Prosopis cineraria TaxID=364024 RepID=UPI00240EF38F|nr:uncharacterized protein LOC129296316 [Prosopis cineraria]